MQERNSLDTWGDFEYTTEAQFQQIVVILQKIYKNKPETIFETFKNLFLRKTNLKKLSKQYDDFEKETRRLNVLARINDEEGTLFVIHTARESCDESNGYSEALTLTLERISIYHKIYKNKNKNERYSKLEKLGELAVRVCTHQKHNYW